MKIFDAIRSLSNKQIASEILQTEKILFKLNFNKATQKKFKSHQVKLVKQYLAKLKSILTLRLNKLEKNKVNTLNKLYQQSYNLKN